MTSKALETAKAQESVGDNASRKAFKRSYPSAVVPLHTAGTNDSLPLRRYFPGN